MAKPMMLDDAAPEAPAPTEGDDGMEGALETHMSTLMAAMKAGQARKAANALKNFIEACSGSDEPDELGGMPSGPY